MNEDAGTLADAVETLVREWFKGQIGDLPPDELPPEDEIEADIESMRDEALASIARLQATTDSVKDGRPNDAANRSALDRLASEYRGLERATPIFTALALSKRGLPEYASGWRLCAIRLIAEEKLPSVRRTAKDGG